MDEQDSYPCFINVSSVANIRAGTTMGAGRTELIHRLLRFSQIEKALAINFICGNLRNLWTEFIDANDGWFQRMLQVDFLESGAAECPLIRIAGGDDSAYQLLHALIVELSEGKADAVAINSIAGVSSSDGTRLTAVTFGWNQGVIRCDPDKTFEWRLTERTWDNVAGLLEPFCEPRRYGGFQWIESAGDIRVLVTTTGDW